MREDVSVEPHSGVHVYHPCDNRRHNHHQRYPTVAHRTLGEDTKAEHTQQRSVGITGHFIHRLNHRVVIEHVDHIDTCDHQYRHAHVHPSADLREVSRLLLIENIHRERGRECRQRATRSRICRCDKSNNEQYAHNHREIVTRGEEWEDIIALERHALGIHQCYTHLVGIGVEQEAQEEEQTDHHNLHECAHNDILLALTRVLA